MAVVKGDKVLDALVEHIVHKVETDSAFVEKSGYTLETLRRVLRETLRGKPAENVDAMARARNRLLEYTGEVYGTDQYDTRLTEALEILSQALDRPK